MLQRKRALEIRVQHAMRKHNIRKPPTHHAISAVTMELPQSMDHHAIEARKIFRQPRLQSGRLAIASLGRPQRVHREFCP